MGQTAASHRGPDGSGAGGEHVGREGGWAYAIACSWWERRARGAMIPGACGRLRGRGWEGPLRRTGQKRCAGEERAETSSVFVSPRKNQIRRCRMGEA